MRPEGPPAWPRSDPEVYAAINKVLSTGQWGQYLGEEAPALEAELARFHGLSHALTCASGTLAVEAALRALKVGPGDEVIMAAYDYEPNFLTIHNLKAIPVLVDVAAENWNLDFNRIAGALTSRTRAILCSHLHGGSVAMREVMELARSRGIGVVEDAAQAPGATIQGKPAGSWGDIGVLSFGGSKLLTAGRGGALLTADPQLHQRARLWLHRGLQQWAPMSELQAAAIRPQLRNLASATSLRWQRVQELAGLLGGVHGVPGLQLLATASSDSTPAFYKVGFDYDCIAAGLPRQLFARALRAEGIALDVGFKSLFIGRSPSRFRAGSSLTQAAAAHERCVILHHPVLGERVEDLVQVVEAMRKLAQAAHAGLFPRGEP